MDLFIAPKFLKVDLFKRLSYFIHHIKCVATIMNFICIKIAIFGNFSICNIKSNPNIHQNVLIFSGEHAPEPPPPRKACSYNMIVLI